MILCNVIAIAFLKAFHNPFFMKKSFLEISVEVSKNRESVLLDLTFV